MEHRANGSGQKLTISFMLFTFCTMIFAVCLSGLHVAEDYFS